VGEERGNYSLLETAGAADGVVGAGSLHCIVLGVWRWRRDCDGWEGIYVSAPATSPNTTSDGM